MLLNSMFHLEVEIGVGGELVNCSLIKTKY